LRYIGRIEAELDIEVVYKLWPL